MFLKKNSNNVESQSGPTGEKGGGRIILFGILSSRTAWSDFLPAGLLVWHPAVIREKAADF